MMFSLLAFSGCSEPYEFTEGDFELTIEVDRDTFAVGEIITITATLKNLSGRSHRITYWRSLMFANIPGTIGPAEVYFCSRPQFKIFERDDVIQKRVCQEGAFYKSGTYELTVVTRFVFGRSWRSSCRIGEAIRIYSNTINLYVYEN